MQTKMIKKSDPELVKHQNYALCILGVFRTLKFNLFTTFRLSQLYRTFNMSLAVALHRATPYLIGITVGIIIKEFGKVQLPRGAIASGWISTICAFIWCFYTPSNLSHKDYQYNPSAAGQYSALAPLLWSLSIAWIIFACHSDASWKLDFLLSSRPMIFISKISYSVYLVVFLVFFYFSGTLKSGEEFHLSSYIDRLEIFIVFVIATLFTLAVDLPMQNIVKLLLNSGGEKSSISNGKSAEELEVDFESPFADEEEDFVFKPVKYSFKFNATVNNHENTNGE
jgi:peptidoglycan/LPS O-acetylase OafA/YrhL